MSIAYSRHGICPAWVARISPAGIREVALFVYSLSHPRGPAAATGSGVSRMASSFLVGLGVFWFVSRSYA
jgi:hypothetical protein